jgi:hypothetical protein
MGKEKPISDFYNPIYDWKPEFELEIYISAKRVYLKFFFLTLLIGLAFYFFFFLTGWFLWLKIIISLALLILAFIEIRIGLVLLNNSFLRINKLGIYYKNKFYNWHDISVINYELTENDEGDNFYFFLYQTNGERVKINYKPDLHSTAYTETGAAIAYFFQELSEQDSQK